MGFLNPVVLAGLAAVAVPIAIHFFNKFQVRRTSWAAMRFVAESLRRNRRRLQMEDLLLLLVRCLLVALLVLAFAQPVLRTRVAGGSAPRGSVAVAVVLDNSASMGQSNGVQTRFEQGKEAIKKAIDGLDSGSMLSFFLVSDRADALVAKPSLDVARIRRSLQLAPLTNRTTDLAQGVRAAYESLKGVSDRPREIWLYTDSQAPGWSGITQIKQLEQQYPTINFKPFVLGHAGEENLAVTALEPAGGVSAVDQPSGFHVRVGNFGSHPASDIRVRLSVDDAAPCDEALLDKIEPGATRNLTLFAHFQTSGFHAVTATIPADRLPVDNQRAAAVNVADRLQVLIVESNPQAAAVDRDGYFLANALAPVSVDQAATYFLQIQLGAYEGLEQRDLSADKVVFLCDPSQISPALATALTSYVQKGGNLVVFPGPATNPATWEPTFTALLPANVGAAQATDNLKLQATDFTHPVTELWNDPAQGGLGTVTFNHYFPLQLKDSPGAEAEKPQVMLRLSDRTPAAVEWTRGNGRVALFNSTATSEWNNLPLHPAFVPLMQRLLGYLSRSNATRLVLAPGDTFRLPVDLDLLGKEFSIVTPGPDTSRHAGGTVEMDDQHAVIRFRDTDAVGAYRIFLGDASSPAAVFAVQMDPQESDLRQEDASDVAALQLPPESTIATSQAAMEITREYWTALIWTALALVLIELLLAHYISRSK